jgi:site-specific DNA-methyltransferase (adenine-specific)
MPDSQNQYELFPEGVKGYEFRLGDCIEGMTALPADSIDLVVTSPPYNLGIKYGKYQDNKSSADYLAWTREWVAEVTRVLKPTGSFFLNVGASSKNPFLPHEVILEIRDLLTLQNTIHWIKSITVETVEGETVSAGHFKPINSKRFINDCHEYLFHLTHEGDVPLDRRGVGVPYVHKSNIDRWGHTDGADKRCRGNTWFVPYKTIVKRDKDRPHPATFPAQLAEYCVRLHGGDPAEIVMMDPFVGIGHAAIGARDAGVVNFVGFEIDEAYLEIARDKLAPPPENTA